jgi:glycosyltransferase involved in cell wall biosynthesis
VDDILKGLPGCALARPEDPSDLARAITEALEAQSDPEALTRSVRERFGADTITRRYEAVFEEAVRSVR